MPNQKGSVGVIALVILILVIAAGSMIYFESNKTPETAPPTPSQSAEAIPSPTATVSSTPSPLSIPSDWKTYANTEYGFELKYPANWFVKPEQSKTYFQVAFSTDFDKIGGFAALNIYSGQKDLETFANKYEVAGYIRDKTKFKDIEFNQIKAKEIEMFDEEHESSSIMFIFVKDGTGYVLIGSESSLQGDPGTKDIIRKLLYTLQFTK